MPQNEQVPEVAPLHADQETNETHADELFVDQDFPADDCFLNEDAPKGVKWQRPFEICDEPQLFVEGASRFDVVQGDVGNCWSMAACAALADRPELVKKVVPDGQILYGPGYTGRIVIRLWHMESWRDVEIDDRLPVVSDDLIYARCSNNNEFWMPLVEKALAKFHGGYQNLSGGQLPEGFVNLTGYSVRNIFIEEYKDKKNKLFHLLDTEMKNKSLVACARGGTYERGLPDFHGFTVTGASHLRTDNHRVRLIRVRNPWADNEWNGKWRDNHDVWKELGPEYWEKLEFQVQDDGEFWIKLVDFIKYFDELSIASRLPSVHEDQVLPATHAKAIRSAWAEETAGGPWGSETFHMNPQFLLGIEEATKEEIASYSSDSVQEEEYCNSDEETNGKTEMSPSNTCNTTGNCHEEGLPVLIELLQDHNRRFTTDLHTTGFNLFKVEGRPPGAGGRWPREQLGLHRLLRTQDPGEAQSCVRSYVHLVPGGRYLVIPSTKAAGEQRRFLLRVFARNALIHLRQLAEATAVAGGDSEP